MALVSGGTVIGMEFVKNPETITVERVIIQEVPKIETVIEYREAGIIKAIYTKEVPTPYEVLVKVPDYELRQFKNKVDVLRWLRVNKVESLGKDQCVEEALELQRRAFRDGYQVSTEALFWGKSEPETEYWHMVNSTVIGGIIVFMEPVKGYIWQGGHSIK